MTATSTMTVSDGEFLWINDSAHGWLRVREHNIAGVGLGIEAFSKYSYRDKDGWLYLEEDCDATRFIVAYQNRCGRLPKFDDLYVAGEAFVRNLPRIKEA